MELGDAGLVLGKREHEMELVEGMILFFCSIFNEQTLHPVNTRMPTSQLL